MNKICFVSITIAALLLAAPASAACYYKDELYAKTTLAQEYQDSTWVVQATVVRQHRGGDNDDHMPWVSYDLKVTESFKGMAPAAFIFYTERNSGVFYLEPAYDESGVDEEYLLFLNPNKLYPDDPPESKSSVFVNYSCGQSKMWKEVTATEKAALRQLSSK